MLLIAGQAVSTWATACFYQFLRVLRLPSGFSSFRALGEERTVPRFITLACKACPNCINNNIYVHETPCISNLYFAMSKNSFVSDQFRRESQAALAKRM